MTRDQLSGYLIGGGLGLLVGTAIIAAAMDSASKEQFIQANCHDTGQRRDGGTYFTLITDGHSFSIPMWHKNPDQRLYACNDGRMVWY